MSALLDTAHLDALLGPLPVATRQRLVAAAVEDVRTFAATACNAPNDSVRNGALHQLRGAAGGVGAAGLLGAIAADAPGDVLVALADSTAAALLLYQ